VNLFVQLASQFESKIDVVRGDERVDGKSILSVLTLAAAQGTELSIEATGQDADAALDALADLVAKGFAEEEVNP
jgi:phosphocarrier protein